MPLKLFSEEYNKVKEDLKTFEYGDPLKTKLTAVKTVLGNSGPSADCAAKLNDYRTAVISEESKKIMQSAGIDFAQCPTSQTVEKAAVAKFLRHLYFITGHGTQSVWVFSSPNAYSEYPTEEFKNTQGSVQKIKSALDDKNERFSDERKKNLGESTLTALYWAMRAQITLSSASLNPGSLAKIKRWFADDKLSDEQLKATISTLSNGFKKISSTLNSSLLIYTDMASLRRATSGDDKNYLESEAFVYAGRYEKLPIVYIENAFFKSRGNVLSGPKNWARIIVHELTHLDCSTTDEKYAWAGITPGKSITTAQAAKNADSWAYFAADCAGALTDGDIKNALGGII
jgi:hypothetical protein